MSLKQSDRMSSDIVIYKIIMILKLMKFLTKIIIIKFLKFKINAPKIKLSNKCKINK